MRVLIASDAWRPQINGVVRSLEHMAELAPGFGAEVTFLTPERFCSIALPIYPEIRLAMPAPGQIRWFFRPFSPDGKSHSQLLEKTAQPTYLKRT